MKPSRPRASKPLSVPTWEWEQRLRAERGWQTIAGVDEAGRGPLAGPVVAAAVVLPGDFSWAPAMLNDSKKLTAKRREAIYAELLAHPGVMWATGIVEPAEIDRLDILRATWRAMALAVEGLAVRYGTALPDGCLVDGLPVQGLPVDHVAVVKGDALSLSIAAASIVAKVTRDHIMLELDREYPAYGLARHMGYGTAAHLAAIRAHGPSPCHRLSFAPCRPQPDLFGDCADS